MHSSWSYALKVWFSTVRSRISFIRCSEIPNNQQSQQKKAVEDSLNLFTLIPSDFLYISIPFVSVVAFLFGVIRSHDGKSTRRSGAFPVHEHFLSPFSLSSQRSLKIAGRVLYFVRLKKSERENCQILIKNWKFIGTLREKLVKVSSEGKFLQIR